MTSPPAVTGLTDSSDSGEVPAGGFEVVFHDANSVADSTQESTTSAADGSDSMVDSTTSIDKGWMKLTGDEV